MDKPFYKWVTAAFILLLSGILLTGCGNSPGTKEDVSETKTTQSKPKQEKEFSLDEFIEQGYYVATVRTNSDNSSIVILQKEGDETLYYGVIDDHFKWTMKPTTEFEGLEYREGLAVFSIPETREQYLDADPYARLYGFINTSGDVVIEPVFREAGVFSNGVAFAKIIDGTNENPDESNYVLIDKKGKILTEPENHNTYGAKMVGEVLGDYLYTNEGYFNLQGEFASQKSTGGHSVTIDNPDQGRYIIIDDIKYTDRNLSEGEDVKQNSDLFATIPGMGGYKAILDSSGENRAGFEIYANSSVNEGLIDHETLNRFINKKLLLARSGSDKNIWTQYLLNTDLDVILQGNLEFDKAVDLVFEQESERMDEATFTPLETGTFYNLKGKEQFKVTDMVGALIEGHYFTKTSEYFIVKNTKGKTVIDESKRIVDTELSYYNEDDYYFNEYNPNTPTKKLVRISYLKNVTDTEPTSALLNMETLKIKDYDELLQ